MASILVKWTSLGAMAAVLGACPTAYAQVSTLCNSWRSVDPQPSNPFTAQRLGQRMSRDANEREQTDFQFSGSVARDSHGRLYQETRFGNPAVQNKQPNLRRFAGKAGVNVVYSMRGILDCGGGRVIKIYPDQEIAQVEEGLPREPDHTLFFETLAYMQRPPNTVFEDLGYKDIEGFTTHGFRVTVLGTPQDGEWNGKPTDVTEAWVSDDLATTLLEVHKNLRSKFESTDTLSHISRQEPDASLFEMPVGYKINPSPEENPFNVHSKPSGQQ